MYYEVVRCNDENNSKVAVTCNIKSAMLKFFIAIVFLSDCNSFRNFYFQSMNFELEPTIHTCFLLYCVHWTSNVI